MFRVIKILCCLYLLPLSGISQQFERLPIEKLFKTEKKIMFREMFVTSKGDMIITSSIDFAEYFGGQFTMAFPMGGLTDSKGNPGKAPKGNIFEDAYYLRTGFKGITGMANDIIYLVSDNNHFGLIDYKIGKGFWIPPFSLPADQKIDVRKIWLDPDGDLFIAAGDTIYMVKDATNLFKKGTKGLNYKTADDGKGNTIVTEGARVIRKFSLGKNITPLCFAQDVSDELILIGTNRGIFQFDKEFGHSFNLFQNEKDKDVSVTHIDATNLTEIWFSTIEKGMGSYSIFSKTVQYYPYKNQPGVQNPIPNFSSLSDKEFLVATGDSLPAIFNIENYKYDFISDTAFNYSKGGVADIQIASGKTLFVIKGGELYVSRGLLKNKVTGTTYPAEPYLKELLVNGKQYRDRMNFQLRNDSIKKIVLNYKESHLDIIYAGRGVTSSDTVMFGWKLDGLWNDWQVVPLTISDERMNMVNFDLKPGTYVFHVKMKIGGKDWLKKELSIIIIIEPPFWQTWWFWTAVVLGVGLIASLILWWRIRAVKKREREKFAHEKQIMEMEAKALRAQMNPNFIFNCLNSIKSLIQQHDEEKSVAYLTTFSKLIRNLFNNADKKEISLYDEIETCKYYLQLEAMRFDTKFSYAVNVDENIDLKSIQVPALIIQPFIENAIWHGIVPRNSGGHVLLHVFRKDGVIEVVIDDDGIGREASAQNRSASGLAHQSKGVNLTQTRLELNNLLQQRQAKLEVIDKKDENGLATGTTVILSFKESE